MKDHSNMLIKAAKSVDKRIIDVEALGCWQRLKIHGMSLAQYLGEGKMEVLCQEVKSSTRIKLKMLRGKMPIALMATRTTE